MISIDQIINEMCEVKGKETDIRIRHNEAVTAFGKESELIKFKKLPEVKVLSICHKGAYDKIGEAYAFLMKWLRRMDIPQQDWPENVTLMEFGIKNWRKTG